MANVAGTQLIEDGVRNTIIKLTGVLDSSDEAYTIKLDPATLAAVRDNTFHATRLRVQEFRAVNIEDGITVNLWWDVDGTQPNAKLIYSLHGRQNADFRSEGGLTNNATNPTGKIALSTEGWQAGVTLNYSLTLWVTKYGETP